MFDPRLAGYWGGGAFDQAQDTCLAVIAENADKVDGIKISLLDKNKEIEMRRRLPDGVKMYTGDDFNYPELIAGDAEGYSHALLGIFDPLAVAVGKGGGPVGRGRRGRVSCHARPDGAAGAPHLPRAHPVLQNRRGVPRMAQWLSGAFCNARRSGRPCAPLPYFVECFRMADEKRPVSGPGDGGGAHAAAIGGLRRCVISRAICRRWR